MASRARAESLSQSQKEVLVDFMQNHIKLRKGKFSQGFTKRKAEKLWKQLTATLNAMSGARKDFKHWRKAWQDLRSAAKQKASQNIDLSKTETTIINLIGKTAVEGHPDTMESAAHSNRLPSTITDGDETLEHDPPIFDTGVNCVAQEATQASTTGQEDSTSCVNVTMPKKRRIKTQRFEITIRATDRLVHLLEQKIKLKEDYYAEKLQLLKVKVTMEEHMTTSIRTALATIISKNSL